MLAMLCAVLSKPCTMQSGIMQEAVAARGTPRSCTLSNSYPVCYALAMKALHFVSTHVLCLYTRVLCVCIQLYCMCRTIYFACNTEYHDNNQQQRKGLHSVSNGLQP